MGATTPPVPPTWKRIATAIRKTEEHIQKANSTLQQLKDTFLQLQEDEYAKTKPTPFEVDLMKQGNETLLLLFFGFNCNTDDFGHPRHPDNLNYEEGEPNPNTPKWVNDIYIRRGQHNCIFKKFQDEFESLLY